MKRNTPDHPKAHSLAALLKLPRYAVVGILECLWHFAQKYATAGDVGRYPDEAVARALGWEGEAAVLMAALADSGWLDRCRCHRYRVHDWPQHADQTTCRYVRKHGGWLACYSAASSDLAPDEQMLAPDESASAVAVAVAVASAIANTSASAVCPPADAGNGALPPCPEYIHEIAAAFHRETGRPQTQGFDSVEFAVCRKWYEQRIPLRIVLTAIEETKDRRSARRLQYFGPSVEEAFRRWFRATGQSMGAEA